MAARLEQASGQTPQFLLDCVQKGLPMPGVYSLLYQAIEEKKQVIAMYDGYLREMCPHVLGSKDGVRHVLLFQFAGDSSQGLPPGGQWKEDVRVLVDCSDSRCSAL